MEKIIQKECRKHGICEHVFYEKRNRYRCKKCNIDAVNKRRKKMKTDLIDMFGGKCCICGYEKQILPVYEFHHLFDNKDFALSATGRLKSLFKFMNEAKKCLMVCANCHREIHYGLYTRDFLLERYNNQMISFNNYEKKNEIMVDARFTRKTNNCEKCGKEITSRAKLCKSCLDINKRKVERPNIEDLISDMIKLGATGTSKKYGVARVTIKRWMQKYKENLDKQKEV